MWYGMMKEIKIRDFWNEVRSHSRFKFYKDGFMSSDTIWCETDSVNLLLRQKPAVVIKSGQCIIRVNDLKKIVEENGGYDLYSNAYIGDGEVYAGTITIVA